MSDTKDMIIRIVGISCILAAVINAIIWIGIVASRWSTEKPAAQPCAPCEED